MNKKRLFAIIMCVMLIISSMAVWAASKEIGVGNEKATCTLTISGATGTAKTLPVYSGNSCQTTIQLYTEKGADNSASGSTSCSARQSSHYAITMATSTHRCGSAYGTLTQS